MSVMLVALEPEPAMSQPPAVVEKKVEPKVEPPAEPQVIDHSPAPKVHTEPPAPIRQPKPKPKRVHEPVANVMPKERAPIDPAVRASQNAAIRPAQASPAATMAANVTTGPKAISRPDPAYSERARALGIEGTVKIQFDVNNDGGLENVQVISATPRNVFERDVRQVTRRWRYESGKPGKNIVVTIQFKLSGVTSTAQ